MSRISRLLAPIIAPGLLLEQLEERHREALRGICPPDAPPEDGITIDGALLVREHASVLNAGAFVRLLRIEGANDVQYNDIRLLENSTGFGGQFYVNDAATIACNNITSEGDRYLDLDPDPDRR